VKPAGTPPAWQWIALEICKDKAIFHLRQKPGHCVPQVLAVSKEGEKAGYEENEKISYWLSFDRDRLVVKYGKGYLMEESTILEYRQLLETEAGKDASKQAKEMTYLFNPIDRKSIEFYDYKPPDELAKSYAAVHLLLSTTEANGSNQLRK